MLIIGWRTVTDVSKGVTLDDATDFTLLNSIVVLIKRKITRNYGESQISGAVKKAKLNSPGQTEGEINRFKWITIGFSDQTAKADGQCVQQYGYKLFTHYLGNLSTSTQRVSLILGIRLLIHTKDSSDNYKELKLSENGTGDIQGGSEHYLYYKTGKSNVYVYFYGQTDPRPLLLCYNNSAYKPSSTSGYDSKWIHESKISKCGCNRGNPQLLDALTKVVGVLNKVELQKRPGKCEGETGVAETTTECDKSSNGNTCTYEVHKYQNKGIKVKVTCKTVTQDGQSSSQQNGQPSGENGVTGSTTCTGYTTVTHEPVGFNGGPDGAGGFRLGDVEYNSGGSQGKLNYYTGPSASSHKWYPVKKVTGYYLGDDFEKPLVVELEFQTTQSSQPPPPPSTSEYYKLTKTGEEMEWQIDKQIASKIGDCQSLVGYLQILKFILNKKIYVLVNEHSEYKQEKLKGITDSNKKKIEVSIYQPKEIGVQGEELKGEQPESPKPPYKKYKHDITVDLSSSHLKDFPDEAKNDVELELIPSIPNVMIPMYEDRVGRTRAKLTFSNGQGTSLSTELYVYFYNHPGGDSPPDSPDSTDKVPLMLQHKDEFYGPKGRDTYFTGWEKLSIVRGAGDTLGITGELDLVNKALNEVKIEETTKGRRESSYGIEKPSVGEGQLAKFSTDRVTVKCEKVGDGGGVCSPSPPGSDTCKPSPYIKYTHTTVNRYELGAIKYKGQDVKVVEAGQRNNVKAIPVQPTDNQLEVYYLTTDTNRKYPLLIKIGKQPGSGGGEGAGADTYYRLKIAKPGTPDQYMWEQDPSARSQMRSNPSKYLNGINYEVKKVLKIELQHNSGHKYQAHWSRSPGQTDTFQQVPLNGGPNGNKEITVEECTLNCSALSGRNYKCFKHQLTNLGEQLNEVGGIALTLPGKPPVGEIVIPLYQGAEGTCANGGDQPINQLFYNKCMGDIYVFFYDGSSSAGVGDTTDTVPLMLWYGGKYYKPATRDEYFDKWVCVNGIDGASDKPCGKDNGLQLAAQLDIVNRALNVIDLFPDKSGTGKGYGLPTDKHTLSDEVGNDRVKVVTQHGPKQPTPNVYTRVVHRTVNGFQIGEINYSGQEITSHGIIPALGANITLKRENGRGNGNNHKESVTQYKWNTVVAYYSGTDKDKKLPQLIVVLKTDNPISERTPVTGSGNSYGYYILSTKNGSSSGQYEYKWREVTNGSVTLDDATDFTLLNSVVILLEKQDTGSGYGESEISTAINTAIQKQGSIKSPGQSDVNRLNPKAKITLNDASDSAPECSKYGYKVYQHDFGTMVERGEQLSQPPLNSIDLILGVRLLIPAMENGGTENNGQTKYRQLTLSESGTSPGPGSQTHYLYYQKSGGSKVWVYFYGGFDSEDEENGTSDQRPLLLCYNSKAYRPKDKEEYDTTWTWATGISSCDCKSGRGAGDPILRVLTEVVGFLNTVNLFTRPGGSGVCNGGPGVSTTCNGDSSSNGSSCTYEVHKYQGKPITVKVTCKTIRGSEEATSTEGCYYMSMTHTPNGMNGDSAPGPSTTNGAKGFRLGQIIHTSESNKLDYVNGPPPGNNKWYPLIQVTTYYYSEDTGFTKPLLVVLEFKKSPPGPNGTTVQEYYKLKLESGDSSRLQWSIDKGAVARLKGTDGSQVDNTKLIDYLNSIRFENMKVVQIQIQWNTGGQYQMKGGTSGQGTKDYQPINNGVGVGDSTGGKQIEVQECPQCEALTKGDYKCFQHKLKSAVESGKLENTVGGIKLTVPGSGPTGDVEIPLYKKKPGEGNGGGNGAKKIEVAECENCDKLLEVGYKCFQHKLVEAIKDKEDEVGGIKLTIPGNPPGNDVEIPLHRKKPGTEGNGGGNGGAGSNDYVKITPLTYNKCMGDIYVYFYKDSGKSDRQPDTVPLMLVYNNKFYKPETRDEYFNKWIPVDNLNGGVKPGKGCGVEPNGAQKLVTHLDDVNRELNRIELDNEKVKRGSGGYGLPSTGGAGPSFPTERVTVVERAPTDPNARSTYTRIVHRTVNGFTVGALTSKGGKNDITSAGFQVTGGPVISVKNGAQNGDNNHTVYTNLHKLNTVVVYYSNTDKDKKLPQLMVLLHTGEAIKPGGSEGGGQGEITGSGTQTKYGYYIIAIKQGGGDGDGQYEYKWVEVNGKPDSTPAKQLVLNDATDFNLLNSVVILLEQRGTSGGTSGSYGDNEISAAVRTAIGNRSITASPGNSDDVNRLTGEKITIQVADGDATALSRTGFKLITHDVSKLVTLNKSLKGKLGGVTLIGGLRFLIPTHEKDKYKQLTLNGGEPSKPSSDGLIMYHQPSTRGDNNNKICVFFYQGIESASTSNTGNQSNQGDPRPLLFCYNKQGYAPKDLKCYFEEWVKDKDVTDCKCEKSGDGDKILQALVKVSNFLNPVNIKRVPFSSMTCRIYNIHWFNGQTIMIKLTSEPGKNGFCYDKYTHTHYGACNGGILSSGTGFRLGEIRHGKKCIEDKESKYGQCINASQESRPYKPSPEVVTYYYKGDKGHKNPLLVVLKGNDGQYTPYYELQKPGDKGGAKEAKKYAKNASKPIKLDDTKTDGQLAQKLDEILNAISNKLQIILSERPLARIKCLEMDVEKNGKKINEPYPCGCVKKEEPGKHPPPKGDVIPPFYVAQLYPPTGQPVSTENKTTHVLVEEVRKCKELALRGYRCYKHLLTEVAGIEEVGGLKLYLWKEQGTEIELFEEPDSGILEADLSYCEKVELRYNICKGNLYVYFYGEDPRPLMLCYDGKGYNDSKLECMDVYFNKHYENKTPLLFVLQFQGFSGLNKYYKMSEFDRDFRSGKKISELEGYFGDSGILSGLKYENDKLTNFLTFDITKKGDDNGRGNQYNEGNI